MHHHLEIILPPSAENEIKAAVAEVMNPFDEASDNPYAFWDWYVIGGRWDSVKLTSQFDQGKLDTFWQALRDMEVTVSSVMCGAQELSPASQIGKVDKLFNDLFPEWNKPCPFFKHGLHNQYEDNWDYPNVMPISDIPRDFTASSVIIAGNGWYSDYAAKEMFSQRVYNGVSFLDTRWDGTLHSAIDYHHDKLAHAAEDFRDEWTVVGNWLAVTVDYHS